jgi:hypothetical protein
VSTHRPVKGPALTHLLGTADKPDAEKAAKIPLAELLLAVFRDNYYPFRSMDGEPLVAAQDVPSVALTLRGKGGLRRRLAADLFILVSRAASQDALATVMNTLDGLVETLTEIRTPLLSRTGLADGYSMLDLGRDDGWACVIGPGRWTATQRAPVLWKRGGMIGELPFPKAPGCGDISGARHLFNFTEDGQWATAAACQVAGLLYPRSTHPVEIYSADSSGALKTATLTNMKRWTDPGPFVQQPKDVKSWAAVASACHRVAIDNVSAIPAWWSDLLCKAASGDSWADRELYSDSDVVAWSFSSVPMLDGIGMVNLRDDLADRAVRHNFKRPKWFLGDDEVNRTWDREHPAVLAWLLDLCSQVALLHAEKRVERPRSGRMAVFEWVLAAIDALWDNGGAGMAWYKLSQANAAHDAVTSDALALAISETEFPPGWSGHPAEILTKIEQALPLTDDNGKMWTAAKIGIWLPRAASALTKTGWVVEQAGRDRNHRSVWRIERAEGSERGPERLPQPSASSGYVWARNTGR